MVIKKTQRKKKEKSSQNAWLIHSFINLINITLDYKDTGGKFHSSYGACGLLGGIAINHVIIQVNA